METIDFLNVRQGDCSIVRHNSGHVTVIDVCNARPADASSEILTSARATRERGVSGNFQQKKYPVNPISYLLDRGIKSVFCYLQTHPDMDHMDGIEAFFR